MGAVSISLVVLLGLVVLLLALPMAVAFRIEGMQAFRGQITVRCLFGCVCYRLQLPGSGAHAPKAHPTAQTVQTPPRPPPPKRQPGQVLAILRQAAFRRRIYRLVHDLIDATHLRRLRLNMRLGLGDPADTGRLWALVGPLQAVAQSRHGANVRIEPEFMDAVLEFRAQGRLVVVPLQLLFVVMGFVLSPASIRAWRTLRASHA
jgi:hypothetical protein